MGLHERYASLLKGAPVVFMAGRKEREDEIRKQLSVLFDGMMKAVYKTEGAELSIDILSTPQVREFIESHASALDSSFERVKMSDAMRRRLHRSDFIFSGIKTFHELNEAFPSLIDENGDRKSFERFLNDVRSIDQTYNENYLRAEYNFVTVSAEMAAKWEGFMQDGDRYNLQYRTQKDDKVRPEHAALDGVTLPPSDPFWTEFYPPNGWNCRCTVVQVRKSKYPATSHADAMRLGDEALQRDSKGIFRFNPGLEQKTVPDYNPYTIRRCRDCDIAKGKSKLSRKLPENGLCEACIVIRRYLDKEKREPVTAEEKKAVKDASKQWAEIHIPVDTSHGGQPAQRLILHNNPSGLDFVLNKKFFGETFSNCVRADNTIETMELATHITEWLPDAVEIGTEPGRDHKCDFKVMKASFEGREIQFKAKIIGDELILYTMRILK